MKNKTGVILLASVITILSLFYLSFNLASSSINDDIKAYADNRIEQAGEITESQEDSIRRIATKNYKDSIAGKEVYLGLFTYDQVQDYRLNLGLDLQGGMHVTLVVSPEDIIKALSGDPDNAALQVALDSAKSMQKTDQRRFSTLFFEAYRDVNGEGELANLFYTIENEDRITLESTDEDVLELIQFEVDDAINRSISVLRARIDRFGATQPVIQPIKGTGRIEIELPGAQDQDRIEKQLKAVAELKFLELWQGNEVVPYLSNMNSYLLRLDEAAKAEKKETGEEATETEEETGGLFADDQEEEEAQEADTLTESVEGDTAETLFEGDTGATAKQDSVEAAERSLPVLLQKYAGIVVLPFEGRNDYYFMASMRDYEKVNAFFNRDEVKSMLPPNMTLYWGYQDESDDEGQNGEFVQVYFAKYGEGLEAPVTGERVVDAYQTRDQVGSPAVGMRMDIEGAKAWSDLTAKLASEATQNSVRRVAVVLDDIVYSAPGVSEEIPNGQSIINGDFTIEQAKDLASILKAGKLPAPMLIERMVVVGPSLGQESIERGLSSLLIGLALVVIFMIVYYAKGGIIANIALLFNIFFILGILSTPSFGVALTLPGIAGIVLTIGMSIDANVLIFERIREELRLGKHIKQAISIGYEKAFTTIIDSNATTFITAVILFSAGSGLVKGFAVTLMIGILCSFFSAVFITRLIIVLMIGKKKDPSLSFSLPFTKNLFQNAAAQFINGRKIAYIFSGAVIISGLILMGTQGLNLGVAFKGGSTFVVKFDKDVSPSEVRASLRDDLEDSGIEAKTFNGPDQVKITTNYLMGSEKDNADSLIRASLMTGLNDEYGDLNPEILETNKVGATIADDIRNTAYTSVVLALVAIFIYILFRFRKWQFSVGALVALFHDVLFVLSVFAILRAINISFEIDEVFIAAMLTIVGYSINDTVVVFDRVREFLSLATHKDSLKDTLNTAINSTLSRTLMTSVTTLLVVLILFLFGGEALRGFSFAMLIGILIGTYSSIFIATPVVLDTTKEKD